MKQLQIDFDRLNRDGWMKAAQYPKGRGVSPSVVGCVLKRISEYDHSKDKCFESMESIGALIKVTAKSVQRAINLLKDLDLVIEKEEYHQEYRRWLYHRSVNWESLRRLAERCVAEKHSKPSHSEVDISGVTGGHIEGGLVDISRGAGGHLRGGLVDIQMSTKQKELKETTTNGKDRTETLPIIDSNETDEWNVVVVTLDSLKLLTRPKVVAAAKERRLSPDDCMRWIQRYRHLNETGKVPGLHVGWLGNWLSDARSAAAAEAKYFSTVETAKPKYKPFNRELCRSKAFKAREAEIRSENAGKELTQEQWIAIDRFADSIVAIAEAKHVQLQPS
jgi:hypothetical protein